MFISAHCLSFKRKIKLANQWFSAYTFTVCPENIPFNPSVYYEWKRTSSDHFPNTTHYLQKEYVLMLPRYKLRLCSPYKNFPFLTKQGSSSFPVSHITLALHIPPVSFPATRPLSIGVGLTLHYLHSPTQSYVAGKL